MPASAAHTAGTTIVHVRSRILAVWLSDGAAVRITQVAGVVARAVAARCRRLIFGAASAATGTAVAHIFRELDAKAAAVGQATLAGEATLAFTAYITGITGFIRTSGIGCTTILNIIHAIDFAAVGIRTVAVGIACRTGLDFADTFVAGGRRNIRQTFCTFITAITAIIDIRAIEFDAIRFSIRTTVRIACGANVGTRAGVAECGGVGLGRAFHATGSAVINTGAFLNFAAIDLVLVAVAIVIRTGIAVFQVHVAECQAAAGAERLAGEAGRRTGAAAANFTGIAFFAACAAIGVVGLRIDFAAVVPVVVAVGISLEALFAGCAVGFAQFGFAAILCAGIAVCKTGLAGNLADTALAGSAGNIGQIAAAVATGTAVVIFGVQIQAVRFRWRATVRIASITGIDAGAFRAGRRRMRFGRAGFVAGTAVGRIVRQIIACVRIADGTFGQTATTSRRTAAIAAESTARAPILAGGTVVVIGHQVGFAARLPVAVTVTPGVVNTGFA